MEFAAAVTGNTVNYFVGSWVGPKVFEQHWRFLDQNALRKTHDFYERHGGKTLVMARFVPIVRTFAPFVAGVSQMTFARFQMFNVIGAAAWVFGLVFAGYFFGNLPFIKQYLNLIVLAGIGAAVVPLVLGSGGAAYAAPSVDQELPFPCGERWVGSTRASHSPSFWSIDFNAPDDLGKPVVARDIPATREILATFSAVEGVFLYFNDSDLPDAVRQAVECEQARVVEQDGADWDDWSRDLFAFATGLLDRSDICDQLIARIEDGDMLRRHSAAKDGTAPSGASGGPVALNLAPAATVDLPAILALDGDAFIEAFYIQILGRRADPAGLDHHRALIANGMTKEDMLRAIMDSPEFKDRRATITVIGADRLDKKAKRRRKLLSLG